MQFCIKHFFGVLPSLSTAIGHYYNSVKCKYRRFANNISCFNCLSSNFYNVSHVTLFQFIYLFCSFCTTLFFFTGSFALVKHLYHCGIPLALATGSALYSYKLKVSKHPEVFSCFNHVVCSDDEEVTNGKPFPDIYETAVRRFTKLPESNLNVSAIL